MARGLSPLTTTGLLLFISILLGATVMTFGEEFIEERNTLATPRCDTISMHVIDVGGNSTLCYTTNEVRLFIENTGAASLTGFRAQIVGTENVHDAMSDTSIEAGTSGLLVFTIPPLGIPQQIRLTPELDAGLCPQESLTITPLHPCS
ncbi:hypothetical protein GF342_02535 [Candidatus Woesearchaeota archaeon]|nr:hypothetical protein [Candidatus Woesearchaeota archaeon]